MLLTHKIIGRGASSTTLSGANFFLDSCVEVVDNAQIILNVKSFITIIGGGAS